MDLKFSIFVFLFFELVYLGFVDAFWRLQCFGIVAEAQIDPIVSPGKISSHVHTVKGANGFTSTSSYQELLNSNCTSCEVKQDHSAYWTPPLYFQSDNGTFTIVPEVAGHITYYKYTPCMINNTLTYPSAMPNGLVMLSGDSDLRGFPWPVPDPTGTWSGNASSQAALRQKAIGFNCLNYQVPAEPSLYRHFLPDKAFIDANCTDGLRLELLFPQCWNGSLDSSDHKSHLAFPDQGIGGGACPEDYPMVINQLFYETIFNTTAFLGQPGQFVLSNGDPTGYGYHGGVMVAWDIGILDQATEQCGPDAPGDIGSDGTVTSCHIFDTSSTNNQANCKIPAMPANLLESDIQGVQGDVEGPLSALPGDNPIQSGPAPATYPSSSSSSPPPTSLSSSPVRTWVLAPGFIATATADANYDAAGLATPDSNSSTPATTTAPVPPVIHPFPTNFFLTTYATISATIGTMVYDEVLVDEVVTVYVTAVERMAPRAHRPHGQARELKGAVAKRHRHHARGGL